jgi:RNA polymerase sigma-70 factor (ECF subfamily)
VNLRERFTEIVDLHYKDLWSYVSFLTGGPDGCEDIVHQAFLLAFDRLAEGTEFTGDPGKWLRGTARNLVYTWWRERRKLPQDLAERLKTVIDESESVFESVANAETASALEHCLEKLSPEDRAMIRERYEKGVRITEIAEQTKANVTSLRVRLFRIRQALKLCVETQLSGGAMA